MTGNRRWWFAWSHFDGSEVSYIIYYIQTDKDILKSLQDDTWASLSAHPNLLCGETQTLVREMGSTFFKTISATLVSILGVQAIGFQDELGRSQSPSFGGTPSDNFGIHLESWDLTEGIHINSTSNFVFETVNSLLQHWPNTRYHNGKSHLYRFSVPTNTF